MNRRQFALTAVVSSVIGVAGCDSEQKPDPFATLLNNPAVHSAFKKLDDASSSLESSVEDFDSENWQDVVDAVKTDATDVADAVTELKQALGYPS